MKASQQLPLNCTSVHYNSYIHGLMHWNLISGHLLSVSSDTYTYAESSGAITPITNVCCIAMQKLYQFLYTFQIRGPDM